MNIVFFGQQNWDVAWTSKQQLLTRLARRGHRVLYVDPIPRPLADGYAGRLGDLWPRVDGPGVRQVQAGLHVYTPPTLWLPWGMAGRWLPRLLAAVAERLGLWAPVAVCAWPAQRWLVPWVNPTARVYFAFDDNSSFAGLTPDFAGHQRREELALLAECDVALGVSPMLVDRFRQTQPRSYLQENGVDIEDFAPTVLETIPLHPVFEELDAAMPDRAATAGFVGQIDTRLDQDLLVSLARRRRDVAFVLTGRVADGVDVRRLEHEPNVRLTGFVPYRELGGIYRGLDVGLIPYVSTSLTNACNPLKAYEYLAADLPVVSTNLAGLNSLRDVAAVCDTPKAYVEAFDEAVRDPAAGRERRREVAMAASWQRRADEFEERLREAERVAQDKRGTTPGPRPDRRGRTVVKIPPRLDGKDQSVRLLSNDYQGERLSGQQELLYLVSRVIGYSYYLLRRGGRLLRGDRRRVARILVVRNGHLGDTVVFFPTLAALRSRFPKATITVAVAPKSGGAGLLAASPYVDEVLELDFFTSSRRQRFEGVATLLRRGFDLMLGGVWYFHLAEAVFSGAPLRLGLYDGHPLQRYADRVVPLDPTLHEAENNLRLAELVTGQVPLQDRMPRMHLDEAKVAAAGAEFRRKMKLDADTPVVAMHPGSKRPSRRWPPERFAELATQLLRDDPSLQIVFTGYGEDEHRLIESIRAQLDASLRDRARSGYGAGSLIGLIGFYDTCRCLVCNDTGVMHVARARGVPIVAIIGPENDKRWGPHPLGLKPAIAVRQQVPGTPHNRDTCRWNLSLGSIAADRVAKHVKAILNGDEIVEPIEIEGQRFYPTVRDVERLSFEQLHSRGLAVPKVAALIPRSPALLGLPAQDEPATAAELADAARRMAGQHYPELDVLLVTDDPSALKGLDTAGAVIVDATDLGPDATWAAALSSTQALLILPTAPHVQRAASAVAARVSVFLRGPDVDVAGWQQAVAPYQLPTAWASRLFEGDWLLTRSALVDLLQHPLPAGADPDLASVPVPPAVQAA